MEEGIPENNEEQFPEIKASSQLLGVHKSFEDATAKEEFRKNHVEGGMAKANGDQFLEVEDGDQVLDVDNVSNQVNKMLPVDHIPFNVATAKEEIQKKRIERGIAEASGDQFYEVDNGDQFLEVNASKQSYLGISEEFPVDAISSNITAVENELEEKQMEGGIVEADGDDKLLKVHASHELNLEVLEELPVNPISYKGETSEEEIEKKQMEGGIILANRDHFTEVDESNHFSLGISEEFSYDPMSFNASTTTEEIEKKKTGRSFAEVNGKKVDVGTLNKLNQGVPNNSLADSISCKHETSNEEIQRKQMERTEANRNQFVEVNSFNQLNLGATTEFLVEPISSEVAATEEEIQKKQTDADGDQFSEGEITKVNGDQFPEVPKGNQFSTDNVTNKLKFGVSKEFSIDPISSKLATAKAEIKKEQIKIGIAEVNGGRFPDDPASSKVLKEEAEAEEDESKLGNSLKSALLISSLVAAAIAAAFLISKKLNNSKC